MFYVDLHNHSTYSDGVLTPAELAEKAHAAGISLMALTDHDSLQGLAEMQAALSKFGMGFIPGVELSARTEGKEIHVLCYGIRNDCEAFNKKVTEIREKRSGRFQKMLDKLTDLGLPLDTEIPDFRQQSPGRPHIAAALVKAGYVKDIKEAFNLYLANGMPAYVPNPKLEPEEAVELAHMAGGKAVLAHPEEIGDRELAERLLKTADFDGVEVYHPSADEAASLFWREKAEKYGLFMTGGSDYHGMKGRFPENVGGFLIEGEKVKDFLEFFDFTIK